MSWLKDKAQGAAAGGAVLGPMGVIPGAVMGSKKIDDNNPYVRGPRDAKKAKKESQQAAQDLYDQTRPLNEILNQADTDYGSAFDSAKSKYLSKAGSLVGDYTGKIGQLSTDAQNQAKDAKATYTNTILPEYKNAMEMAKTNAGQAMTLAEAGDPNNPIMKAVRELYDQQGQSARKQGQQDFGVLSALGAQAAQGQFGAAGPMTAGQMGQIYAANQSQAGDAYARAQQRMYDLQQQGIDRGFDQSNLMYQFGQDAQDRYSSRIGDLQAGENAFYDQQGRFRDEIGGYAGDVFGARQGLNMDDFNLGIAGADIKKGNAYAGTGREKDALDQLYGVKQQGISNELGASQATNTAKGQLIGSLIGAGGQVAGAYAGRPPSVGAAAGAASQRQSPYDGETSNNRSYLRARNTA